MFSQESKFKDEANTMQAVMSPTTPTPSQIQALQANLMGEYVDTRLLGSKLQS